MTTFEIDKAKIAEALKCGRRAAIEQVELSPEMVNWLLGCNSTRNRKPNPSRIRDLMTQINRNSFLPISDFKFYDGALVDGQHRLMALQRLYANGYNPQSFPVQRIVVNISLEESMMIDCNQTRTNQQRIFCSTGLDYPSRLVSAVTFSIKYHAPNTHPTIDQILDEIQGDPWKQFVREIPPNFQLPNCNKHVSLSAPVYAALKDFYDRAPAHIWRNFLLEFQWENGHDPKKAVTRLRETIMGGVNSVAAKYRGEISARVLLYKTCVTHLKAFWYGLNKYAPKPSDWDD